MRGFIRCAQNDKWGMDWGDAGHPAKADSSAALRNDRQKDRQRQGRTTEILSQGRLRMTAGVECRRGAEVECWRGLGWRQCSWIAGLPDCTPPQRLRPSLRLRP